MPTTEHDKILDAIKDMKKDLIERFDSSINSLKEITHKDILHLERDIATLKNQSDEHYGEEKRLVGLIGEVVVEHAQTDVRHIEEIDIKTDKISDRFNQFQRDMADKVDKLLDKIRYIEDELLKKVNMIENAQIEGEGINKGKDKSKTNRDKAIGLFFTVTLGVIAIGSFIFGVTK